MNTSMLRQLLNFGITVLIALLVWTHYRRKTVPVTLRYSTFGPRFWSGFVDSSVMFPLGFIISGLLLLNIPKALAAVLIVVENLAWLVYTVVMHARFGQTVGKMATKVRVVDFRTEGNISWQQAWLREGIPMALSLFFLGWEVLQILNGTLNPRAVHSGEAATASNSFWILMALPGLWFVAEVLTMLTNDKRRALHDFIAGTVVVRINLESAVAQSDAIPSSPTPASQGSGGPGDGASVENPA